MQVSRHRHIYASMMSTNDEFEKTRFILVHSRGKYRACAEQADLAVNLREGHDPPRPRTPWRRHRIGVSLWGHILDRLTKFRYNRCSPISRLIFPYTVHVFRLAVVVGDTRPSSSGRDRRPCECGVKMVAPAPYDRWVGFPRPTPCASRRRFSHVAAMVSTAPVPVSKPNRVRNRPNKSVYCSLLFNFCFLKPSHPFPSFTTKKKKHRERDFRPSFTASDFAPSK